MRRIEGIDIWHFPLAGARCPEDAALAWLSADERVRYRQFDCATQARAFALRRAVRRVILGWYLDRPPADLAIAEAPGGKPYLADDPDGLCFSASDSGGFGMVVATTGVPVGVDLEVVRPFDAAAIAERILSPAEHGEYRHIDPAQRCAFVLRAWTAREALAKATGHGLDLAAFRQVALAARAGADGWREVPPGPALLCRGGWHVHTGTIATRRPADAIASIAAPRPLPLTARDPADLLARHGLG